MPSEYAYQGGYKGQKMNVGKIPLLSEQGAADTVGPYHATNTASCIDVFLNWDANCVAGAGSVQIQAGESNSDSNPAEYETIVCPGPSQRTIKSYRVIDHQVRAKIIDDLGAGRVSVTYDYFG